MLILLGPWVHMSATLCPENLPGCALKSLPGALKRLSGALKRLSGALKRLPGALKVAPDALEIAAWSALVRFSQQTRRQCLGHQVEFSGSWMEHTPNGYRNL